MEGNIDEKDLSVSKIFAQFKDENDVLQGPPLDLPENITIEQLSLLLNTLLSNKERIPYSFYIDGEEVLEDVRSIQAKPNFSKETRINILYKPQAIFEVRSVSRCISSLEGHEDAVLSSQFSPDGKRLVSGSGDTTIRFWNLNTNTPEKVIKAHKNWVLFVSWSPDGVKVASGGMDNEVYIWEGATGKSIGQPLVGHKGYISCLSWEPFHKNPNCDRLASSSKDSTIRIWSTVTSKSELILSGHTLCVTCIVWGGEDFLYSASRDRTIKVWNINSGTLCRNLSEHSHWINTMGLNTAYVLRCGPFNHLGKRAIDKKEAQSESIEKYQKLLSVTKHEVLVSGSDDFTMFFWNPTISEKSVARLTGHQQLINDVRFSPDGKLFASASFDKSIKLWDGITGKFITTFRGHVGAVYQISWSSDSRLLVSASRDSTLKVWSIKKKKQHLELPGHADEIFTVDWSPNGEKVVSGSKDKLLKIWSR